MDVRKLTPKKLRQLLLLKLQDFEENRCDGQQELFRCERSRDT